MAPIQRNARPAAPTTPSAVRAPPTRPAAAHLAVEPAAVERLAHSAWEGLGRAADRLGGAVRSTGERITSAGRAMEAHGVPGAADVRGLGERTSAAGRRIADAPERATAAVAETRREVEGLAHEARATADRVAHEAGAVADRGVRTLREGARHLEAGVREYASGVGGEVRRLSDVSTLREGDEVRISAGGEGGIEGGRARAETAVDVRRAADGFTVGVEGHLEGGLYVEAGGRAGSTSTGGAAEAEAEAMLGAGGRTEFHFDTAAEVTRASALLARGSSTGGMRVGAPSMSADDARFLREHVSAVELHGSAAAGVEGDLGLGATTARLGLGAEAGIDDRVTARIEFPRDGSGATVEIRNTVTLSGGGSLDATLGHGTEASASLAGLEGRGEIVVRDRFTLPARVDTGRLVSDPRGTLRELGDEVARSTTQEVTLRASGRASARGMGGGEAGAEVTFRAPTGELVRTDAARRALHGDLEGAVRALGPDTTVEARLTSSGAIGGPLGVGVDSTVTARTTAAALADSGAVAHAREGDLSGAAHSLGDATRVSVESVTYREIGAHFDPEFEVMGFGGGIDLEAHRREVVSRTASREMSGTELGELLEASRPRTGTADAPIRG